MAGPKVSVHEGFDKELWEAGVDDGAFAGAAATDATWYIMEAGGKKVALAAAAPGPGDLTTIAYYVAPEERSKGYGTKIASYVTDLHEKATFTIMKRNEASIKVALAALRDKFSMTMGHNVVRLTKTAAGKKEEEPKKLKIPGPPLVTYMDDIAMVLRGLKEQGPALAETAVKAAEARELLKAAISTQDAERVLQTRFIMAKKEGITSPRALKRHIMNAAKVVAKKPAGPVDPQVRAKILATSRYVRESMKGAKGGEIYKDIRKAEGGVSHQMDLKNAADRDDRSKSIEKGRSQLHGLVRPMGGLYKTKGAKGWDVMVDAMLGDTSDGGGK